MKMPSILKENTFLIQDYYFVYDDLLKMIQQEEKAIEQFDIEQLKEIEDKKFFVFNHFKKLLKEYIDSKKIEKLPFEIKNFIHKSALYIDFKITNNIQKLKIESYILKDFFNTIRDESKHKNTVYGIYHKKAINTPSAKISIAYREV